MESLRPRGLVEYLEILWGKKLLIFLVTASVLVATFLVIRRIPYIYESQAVIVISEQSDENRLLQNPSLAILMQQMTSHENMMAIIRRYDLYRPVTPQRSDPRFMAARLRDAIKLDIKNRTYYPNTPESLTITYRYTDPEITRRVVADLVSIFEQANLSMRKQAETELERFRAKVVEIEAQLQKLTPHRDRALLIGKTEKSPDNSPSTLRAQRLATSSSIETLSDKEFMLERQIDEQKRQIVEQEKVARSASSTPTSIPYGMLLTRRAELEGQIKNLALTVTEKNPRMIQARTQLSEVNREIALLEGPSATSQESAANSASPDARELRAMRRELQRLETELEVTRRDLGRKTNSLNELPNELANTVPDDRLNEAKTEYDRLMGRYNWLMDRQDSLHKFVGDDGQRSAMFQVIDSPLASTIPIGPRRRLLMALGLGLAIAIGLLAAAARELPRLFLIHNNRDVEYYLGTPVLALIPETLTPFERSRRRRLWGLRCLGLGLLAATMIPVFVKVLDRIQIFQILVSR